MRTFHEHCDSQVEPIRLSYHGKSHYNAVVPVGWTSDRVYERETPGVVEDRAIARYHRDQTTEDTQKPGEVSDFAKDARLNLNDGLSSLSSL